MATINSLTEALTASKQSCFNFAQEKENFVQEITTLKTNVDEKEKQFESNILELKAQLTNLKENHDAKIKQSSEQIANLQNGRNILCLENEKIKTELQQKIENLITTKNECDLKLAEKAKENAGILEKYRKEKENEIAELIKNKLENEKALSKACAEFEALKAQIRPIGTLLERRFEETRYRLQEANNLNNKYEEMLKSASVRIYTKAPLTKIF